MKKSSLVMILALVGMVGCRSRKQVEPPKDGVFDGHKVLNVDCKEETNQINIHLPNRALIADCYGIEVAMNEHFAPHKDETGLEFCQRFQDASDEFNKQHPNDTVSYGCGNIHPAKTNPISPGNAAVILHETPAKKPAFKKKAKLQEMWGDPPQCVSWKWDGRCAEQPNLLPAEKAAVPVATKPIPHKKMSHDVPEKLKPIVAVEVRDGWDCHFTDYQISENEMCIKCVKSVEKAK